MQLQSNSLWLLLLAGATLADIAFGKEKMRQQNFRLFKPARAKSASDAAINGRSMDKLLALKGNSLKIPCPSTTNTPTSSRSTSMEDTPSPTLSSTLPSFPTSSSSLSSSLPLYDMSRPFLNTQSARMFVNSNYDFDNDENLFLYNNQFYNDDITDNINDQELSDNEYVDYNAGQALSVNNNDNLQVVDDKSDDEDASNISDINDENNVNDDDNNSIETHNGVMRISQRPNLNPLNQFNSRQMNNAQHHLHPRQSQHLLQHQTIQYPSAANINQQLQQLQQLIIRQRQNERQQMINSRRRAVRLRRRAQQRRRRQLQRNRRLRRRQNRINQNRRRRLRNRKRARAPCQHKNHNRLLQKLYRWG